MFHTVQKARLVGNNWPQYRTMSSTNESREQPTQSSSRYEIREKIGPVNGGLSKPAPSIKTRSMSDMEICRHSSSGGHWNSQLFQVNQQISGSAYTLDYFHLTFLSGQS